MFLSSFPCVMHLPYANKLHNRSASVVFYFSSSQHDPYYAAFTLLNIYLIFKCIFSGNVDKHSKGYGKQNLTGRVLV